MSDAAERDTASADVLPAPANGKWSEVERLQALLLDAEQRAATIPQLQVQVAQLERELAAARAEAHEARMQVRRIDQQLTESRQTLVDVMRSPSWQLTKPLRRAKQVLRDARA